MINVNLETELKNQKAKIFIDSELLEVRESERIGEINNADVLRRAGLLFAVDKGRGLKSRSEQLKSQTLGFNQENVFHISQIKDLCDKYYLKFLPISCYKGSIDKDLPYKITNFEVAYNVKLESGEGYRRDCTSYIVAPKESFRLEEKPKDPLLFYKINAEYYYLVHKWGNDLSITRRIYSALSHSNFSMLLLFLIPILLLLTGSELMVIIGGLAALSFGSYWAISALVTENDPEFRFRFLKRNEYDSPFRS